MSERTPLVPQSWHMRVNWTGPKEAWRAALDLTKAIPGAAYLSADKVWLLPQELYYFWAKKVRDVGAWPRDLGHAVPGEGWNDTGDVRDLCSLHPWQMLAVAKIAKNGGVISYATGLGKTATTLRAMQMDSRISGRPPSALIVTPAIVRDHWAAELKRWWPAAAEQVFIAESSDWAASSSFYPVVVTSPELLPSIPVSHRRWLVLDEAHEMKTAGSRRTQAALAHRAQAKKVVALSATLISREPDDIWQILELIWPGRFGHNVWEFRRAYMNIELIFDEEGQKRGTVAHGLREDRADELAFRMSSLVHFASHDDTDVAVRLPPLALNSTWLPAGEPYRGDYSGASIMAWQESSMVRKVNAASEMARTAGKPVAILTHQRATADAIADYLSGTGCDVVLAHGSTASGPRMKKVAAAIESGAHLVSTMHALGVGVDLTRFSRVIIAELYWVPRVLIQALGRFRRLSSQTPVQVDLLCQRRSPDEVMATRLMRRMEEQEALIGGAGHTGRIRELLSPLSASEELAELRSVAAGMASTSDPYLASLDDD